jgi:hypothetical protein
MATMGAPEDEMNRSRLRAVSQRVLDRLRDRRTLAVTAALLVWVLVIAWGSGAAPSDRSWLGLPDLADLLVAFVLTGSVLGLLLFIALLVSGRRSDVDLPARKPRWPLLLVMLVLVAVLVRFNRNEESDRSPRTPQPDLDLDVPVTIPTGVVGRNELLALVVLLVTSAGVMIWTRRRMAMLADTEPEVAGLDQELEPILAEAVESLRIGSDPRSAVLTAYADLESAFAGLGWHRGVTETPSEYVRRVLDRFPTVSGPVTELANLYEIARFSAQPVTTADQRRAAMSLQAVQTRLSGDRPEDLRAGAP